MLSKYHWARKRDWRKPVNFKEQDKRENVIAVFGNDNLRYLTYNPETGLLKMADEQIPLYTTQNKSTGEHLFSIEKNLSNDDAFDVFIQSIQPKTAEEIFESVTADWLDAQMKKRGVKQKDLTEATGVIQSTISAILGNSEKKLKTSKILLWYYFAYLDSSESGGAYPTGS